MRLTRLLVMIACMTQLTGCADDSDESMDAQDATIATDDSPVVGTKPIVFAAPTEEHHVLVNGKEMRMVTDGGFGLASDGMLEFHYAVGYMSRLHGVSVDEVLRLNGWEGLENEKMPEGVLWIHPPLRTEEE